MAYNIVERYQNHLQFKNWQFQPYLILQCKIYVSSLLFLVCIVYILMKTKIKNRKRNRNN